MKRTIALFVVLTFAAGLALAASASAQPASAATPISPKDKGQVILSWDEFVKITGYDPTRKGIQPVTVPWAEVEKLLDVKVEGMGKEGTSVDLPWTDFKALLEWSVQRKKGPEQAPPPTDYIITASNYVGELTEDGAKFTLSLKLDILRAKGWKRIPLLPGTVALTKVTLPEKMADKMFVNSTGNAYELLTEESGAGMPISLEFAVAAVKNAGVSQVTFPRVAAGSSTLELAFDRADVDVKVASAQTTVKTTEKDKTLVKAVIPTGVPLAVSWERALPKVAAVATRMYAETRTLVAVADEMLLCQENVSYSILHTAVRQLKLQAPKGASILTVSGPNVQDWRVDANGELVVPLAVEVIGPYSLNVTYEAPAGEGAEAPVLRTVGTEREKGFIGVIAVSNAEIEAGSVDGATAIDVRRLPGDIVAMTNQPILLAFRYVGEKFQIPLTVKKHKEVPVLVTIADSGLFTAMQMDDGRRMTKALFAVRNNRNQFLRLKMPPGAEIWSVSVGGNPVAPGKDGQGSILIPLIRSSQGSSELASFPVELVYVETPKEPAPASGKLEVALPELDAPVMHVMYNYYLPEEGSYTVGLFGGTSGFTGPLRLVKEFSNLSTGPGAEVLERNAAQQAGQMEQQAQARVDATAKAAGQTPIRVRLPVNGTLFKLEKILLLPGEKLYFQVQYRGWNPAK